MWQAGGMIRGQVFSLVAIAGVAVWLTVDMRRRPERRVRAVFTALFAVYLVLVVQATMFPIPIDGSAPANATRFNLVPFRNFLDGPPINREQAIPNVFLGVPFGFLAFFVIRRPSPWRVLAYGAGLFLAVECLQLLLLQVVPAAPRTADINDVILNVIGVVIGIVLFLAFAAIVRHRDGAGDLGDSDLHGFLREVTAADPA